MKDILDKFKKYPTSVKLSLVFLIAAVVAFFILIPIGALVIFTTAAVVLSVARLIGFYIGGE